MNTIAPLKARVSPKEVESTSLFSLFYKLKDVRDELLKKIDDKFKHVDELSTEAKEASREVHRISKQIEKDFEDLSQEVVTILKEIKSKTYKGDKGDDGYTPKKGVDYFDGKDGETPTIDLNKIAKIASTFIKIPKQDIKIIRESINPEEISKNLQISIKNIKDWKETLDEIKKEISRNKGGYHGGGFNNISSSGTTISTGLDTLNFIGATVTQTGRTVNVTIAGSGFTTVDVSPSPDDTTLIYTASSAITGVNVNGSIYRNGTQAMGGTISISGTTITLPNPVGTGGFIFGIA